MSVSFQEAVEMEVEDEKNTLPNEPPQNESADSSETPRSELQEEHWSIVTHESVAVGGLTYQEAEKWMEKLKKQNLSGLCIVTDEAASRISN